MSEIIIVLLVIALAGASIWLFVIEHVVKFIIEMNRDSPVGTVRQKALR
jgi:hypothetical protein